MSAATQRDCIFCKLGQGQGPSEFLYRDDSVFAVRDIHPKAPVHVLIIPFAHVGALADEPHGQLQSLGSLLTAAVALARQLGVQESGYRLIINQGPHSGQEVPHLHMHLLAGRRLGPMG